MFMRRYQVRGLGPHADTQGFVVMVHARWVLCSGCRPNLEGSSQQWLDDFVTENQARPAPSLRAWPANLYGFDDMVKLFTVGGILAKDSQQSMAPNLDLEEAVEKV